MSSRTLPERFTVNVAVANAVLVVATVDPTCVNVAPWSCEANSPHEPLPSEPKRAWWIVTVPAPFALSKPMVRWPLLRRRAAFAPVLISELLVPMSASFRFQLPVASATSTAAYELLEPASKSSVRVTVPAYRLSSEDALARHPADTPTNHASTRETGRAR